MKKQLGRYAAMNARFRTSKSTQTTIPNLCKADANSTTTAIILYLNYNGWYVSRINTHGVYDVVKQVYRKVHGQAKSVPDIVRIPQNYGAVFVY